MFTGDQAVTSLYRKVVSPSVRFKTEGLQKESHARHVQYRGRSPHTMRHLAASPSIFFTQPSRSAYSAPSRVENRQTVFKVSGIIFMIKHLTSGNSIIVYHSDCITTDSIVSNYADSDS